MMPVSFRVLEKILLSFGGKEVIPMPSGFIDMLLARGMLIVPTKKNFRLLTGEPCECHENTAVLWKRSKGKMKIMTGWALSDDGLWRQHSWGLADDTVIETTTKRDKYYGFVLTDAESKDFYRENI
jgi:hypothetical protein